MFFFWIITISVEQYLIIIRDAQKSRVCQLPLSVTIDYRALLSNIRVTRFRFWNTFK